MRSFFPFTTLLVHYSDVALQVLKEHPFAVRPQAGDHPETTLGLMDPDVLSNVLHTYMNKIKVS